MRWPAIMLVAFLGVAVPAAAEAATRCVGTTGAGCDAVYSTIGSDSAPGTAVNAAAPGDTIRIAPGIYTEEVSTAKALHFVGAGAGTLDAFDPASQTRIAAPAGMSKTALTMKGGGSVASMQTIGGEAPALTIGGSGLALQAEGTGGALDYSVSDVVIVGGAGGYGSSALLAQDPARAINVTMSGGAVGNPFINGVRIDSPGSSSSFTGVTIRSDHEGVSAGAGTLRIVRSSVLAPTALSVGGTAANAGVELVDSVFATPATSGDVPAVSIGTTGAGNASLIARGSTFLSRNTGASAAIRLAKGPYAGALSADLLNTIARTESNDPGAFDLDAQSGGTVTADFSSFTTRRNLTGGTTPAPGGASNVSGDPRFTNSAAGDLTLQPGSPLIDRGDPALVLPGELDLAGNPRSLDGTGDCLAAPDIGAFERPDICPPPPNEAPTVSRFAMTNSIFAPLGARAAAGRRKPKRGTRFRYTLSEAARVTIAIDRRRRGRKVRYRRVGRLSAQKQAGRQSTRFSGRLRGRPLRPGRYRARIVAVDSLGAPSSERSLRFRIVRP